MKSIQVDKDGALGCRNERKNERERFGERGREMRRWEKMAWVDFDRWSKSTTPENVC
jgi:hypothetical protein